MNLVDELTKLEDFWRRGGLTDDEFAQAKAKLLAKPDPASEALQEELAELRLQGEIAELDREWEVTREKYMIGTKFSKTAPQRSQGIMLIVMGIVQFLFVTGITVYLFMSMTVAGTNFIPFIIFSMSSVPMMFLLYQGYTIIRKAREYEIAYANFQAKRNALTHTEPADGDEGE
ncbi:MAG: hypothetical protein ACRC8S_18595 [Fimbriiglobus sp.]